MKVLIIDDDADLLEMTARRLSRKGIQIVIASRWSEARNNLQKNQDLDAIICDLFLNHGENGLEFFNKEIKGIFLGKFILATGDDSIEEQLKKLAKENQSFFSIQKPYTTDQIFNLLNA